MTNMSTLTNKRILLGVTGGIAAYKGAEIIRRLQDAGAEVRVVMTRAASEFITPLTLQALSGNPVHQDLLDTDAEAAMGHIELARWADLVLVAPATADIIARLDNGRGDDLLTTLCLATNAQLVIAPAMNQAMWLNAATQHNIDVLKTRDVLVFGPGEGTQACGDVGPGRLLEPDLLVEKCAAIFSSGALSGLHIIITAGPTREAIDPVRYISNHSSGKQGYALAEAAVEAGARVTLVSGPTALPVPERVEFVPVISAQDMYDAVMSRIDNSHMFIGVAAVADYRCATVAEQKIKKAEGTDSLVIEMVENPDIIADVSRNNPNCFTVGFAAETNNVVAYARKKLERKGVQLIVANDVSDQSIGFNSDENKTTIVSVSGEEELPKMSKAQLSRQLVSIFARHMEQLTQ
jgi:phosphopantothenoylcysteine decarboxylase/phosphopantothenate--cysteine ligase